MVEHMWTGLAGRLGFEMEEVTVTPKNVDVFGVLISETLLATWIVLLILIVLAVLIRIFVIPRFKTVPKGIQNILEIFVDTCEKFTNSQLGKRGAAFAAYIFTVALVIVSTCMIELFGFRPPATDINFTIALALMSFVLINAFGVYYTGAWGRVKWFFKPKAFMLPVNLVTHAVIPVSLSFRLFGNMFAGMVVMDLLYGVMYLKFVIPAVLSIYFNLFHVGIQTYIFLVLTLSFMEETVSYGAKR
jgi:F-type H+-transporting ATPase subunit a